MARSSQTIRLAAINPHCGFNAGHHGTEDYDINEDRSGLVVRRGAPFRIDFRFDGDIDDYDLLTVTLAAEDYGAEHLQFQWQIKESPRRILLDESGRAPIQIFQVTQNADCRTVSVVFVSRPNAVVSKYNLTGISVWRSRNEYFSTEINFPIYLIFNPFHPDDAVYMPDEAERQEYVMEDQGRVYFGSSRKIGSKPWYFAQFENPVLPCALLLLAKSGLAWEKWGDPVEVARTLSALVNDCDDDGLLCGNWSGDYGGGVAPTQWKGSLRIIKQYFETQEPVRYGQCWVFSGCLTSLARSLGIPTRSVTNFDSAHDTDANLTIDKFFDAKYSPLTDRNADSVWNFHVWNDLWMRRPDLGDEFNGWQAVDATPQEASEGVYRTGPCSVEAIKRGLVDTKFDAKFVFAEVNACVKHWMVDAGGARREIFSDPRKIGAFISTKAVGSDARQDVTSAYKFAEGSADEAAAFQRAERLLTVGDRRNDAAGAKAIRVEVRAVGDFCCFGEDVAITLRVENVGGSDRTAKFRAAACLKKYNGRTLRHFGQMGNTVQLKPGTHHSAFLNVLASEYINDCGDEEVGVEIVVTVVDDFGEQTVQQTIISIVRPEVTIQLTEDVVQNRDFNLLCGFENPLPVPLTNCRFTVDGPGLRGQVAIFKVGTVAGKGQCSCPLKLNAARVGQRKFVVSFDCDQLKGAYAELPVVVQPPQAPAADN